MLFTLKSQRSLHKTREFSFISIPLYRPNIARKYAVFGMAGNVEISATFVKCPPIGLCESNDVILPVRRMEFSSQNGTKRGPNGMKFMIGRERTCDRSE